MRKGLIRNQSLSGAAILCEGRVTLLQRVESWHWVSFQHSHCIGQGETPTISHQLYKSQPAIRPHSRKVVLLNEAYLRLNRQPCTGMVLVHFFRAQARGAPQGRGWYAVDRLSTASISTSAQWCPRYYHGDSLLAGLGRIKRLSKI
jgi:hypothetical protein